MKIHKKVILGKEQVPLCGIERNTFFNFTHNDKKVTCSRCYLKIKERKERRKKLIKTQKCHICNREMINKANHINKTHLRSLNKL